MIPHLDSWIINAGAIVAALSVLGGALYGWVIRPTYKVSVGDKIDHLGEKVDDRIDDLTAKLEALAEDVGHRLVKIDDELHTNGGSSLKDQTTRIEGALVQHIEDERDRTRVLGIELRATNARIDARLARIADRQDPE